MQPAAASDASAFSSAPEGADADGRPLAPAAEQRGVAVRGISSATVSVLSERESAAKQVSRWLDLLFDADVRTLLRAWLGSLDQWKTEDAVEELDRQIVRIDSLVADQMNQILHAPKFQKLEAAWRGLQYLVGQTPIRDELDTGPRPVQIRVLPVTLRELERDFDRAVEFDQSALFKLVYTNEFGTAGGTPYGLLLGDYEIRPRSTADNPADDLTVLKAISQVATAAFCPFIAGLSPDFLRLERFSQFTSSKDPQLAGKVPDPWARPEMFNWQRFREDDEHSRFVGLALPRIALRRPYEPTDTRLRAERFRFLEDASSPDLTGILWGNACWAFGEVVIRSFLQTRWFNELTGIGSDGSKPGFVRGLPTISFGSDRRGLQNKRSTDLAIAEELEQQLVEFGFLPLSRCSGTEESAFFAAPSLQQPRNYAEADAASNAMLAASLEVMLCVSRFAHYLKAIGREKLGALEEASDIESFLHGWLQEHTSPLRHLSPEDRADRPLAESQVRVVPKPGHPGSFDCFLKLKPYFTLERMVASVSLKTDLVRMGTGNE